MHTTGIKRWKCSLVCTPCILGWAFQLWPWYVTAYHFLLSRRLYRTPTFSCALPLACLVDLPVSLFFICLLFFFSFLSFLFFYFRFFLSFIFFSFLFVSFFLFFSFLFFFHSSFSASSWWAFSCFSSPRQVRCGGKLICRCTASWAPSCTSGSVARWAREHMFAQFMIFLLGRVMTGAHSRELKQSGIREL